ncbi:MAG TPA: hypothetical protein DHW42_10215 [Candidatus Marinimicrobia bacterium]|nr:hypothetical protein [Candidatus Neomarinimicrobiota bacterium]
MELLKPDWVPDEILWEKAEKFRRDYIKTEDVPVDVFEIIEIDFKIQPVPQPDLYGKCGIDAFLTPDCKELWVDQQRYFSNNWTNRSRFTIAHEIGHLYMHKKELSKLHFESINEWIDFRINNSQNVGRFEYQGHEFAGRLLVPKKLLLEEVAKFSNKITIYKKSAGNRANDPIISHIAGIICPTFGVSEQVISKRIIKENIFKELKL